MLVDGKAVGHARPALSGNVVDVPSRFAPDATARHGELAVLPRVDLDQGDEARDAAAQSHG